MIQIQKVVKIPFEGFTTLLEESEQEGHQFLRRLEVQWLNGKNSFSLEGEGFYKAMNNEELIGLGGINQDPYSNKSNIGRIRRFYIKKSWRQQGVGSLLLIHILTNHGLYFDEINLRTDSPIASSFYEKNGFEKTANQLNITHKLR